MRIIYKTIRGYYPLVTLILSLLLINEQPCSAERTKKYEKRVPVRSGQGITIANFSHCDFSVKYHDKQEVYYNFTVRIESSDDDDEAEFIDSFYVRDRTSDKEIVVQMIDRAPANEKSDVTIFGIDFGEEFSKSCKGEIYIPQSAWVNIGIRSCKMNVEDMQQEVKIIGEYNTITAKNCKNIKNIMNKYGSVRLYSCSGYPITLEGRNGTYSSQNSNDITINAPYSKIELYEVNGKAEVQSRSGTIRAKNVSQGIVCAADYSSITLEKIKNKTSISSKSATLNISETEALSIDADYSTIGIKKVLSNDSVYGVEIVSRSSTIRLDDITAKTDIESPFSTIGLRDIRGSVTIIGKSSTVNGARLTGNIDITTDGGGVELREVRAKNIHTETTGGKIRYSLQQHPEKLSLYAEQGTVVVTMPPGFDGELHLSCSKEIESNLECITSSAKTRKFDGKSKTGKKSIVTIRSSSLRFDEN